MIRHFLAQNSCYRRWSGGIWFYVNPEPFPYMFFWQREKPSHIERLIEVEADGVDITWIYKGVIPQD